MKLTKEMIEAFSDIMNLAIGEATMGVAISGEELGNIVYKATGLNAEELYKLKENGVKSEVF